MGPNSRHILESLLTCHETFYHCTQLNKIHDSDFLKTITTGNTHSFFTSLFIAVAAYVRNNAVNNAEN